MGQLAGARIHLFTNDVAGGWSPAELPTGLGGSEEVIVLWTRALAQAGAEVTVFSTLPPEGGNGIQDGPVRYRMRRAFDPAAARDVLVTWKDPRPWLLGARAGRRIHWSSDVEPAWPSGVAERLHAFVCLTRYHAGRMPWVPQHQMRIVPHGIDTALLDACRSERDPNLALYASSPDRGLERLLEDWPAIRTRFPALELHVTYGWRHFDACMARLPPAGQTAAARFRKHIAALAAQPGVHLRGALPQSELAALYWRARYWMLPLEVPDAELFCLNAVKARHCGAVPVIHRIGALQDTVPAWVPYGRFLAGDIAITHGAPGVPIPDWNEVLTRYWIPLLLGER